MSAYSSVLNKVNAATAVTVASGILSAVACLGVVPHSNSIIQISGFAGTLIASLVMVWHAKPSTSLQALHSFVGAIAQESTPEQKAQLIQAASNYISSAPTTTVTTTNTSPTSVVTTPKKS